MLHIDINKLHVNVIMLHGGINKLHVNITVDIKINIHVFVLLTYVLAQCLWQDKMAPSEWQKALFQDLLWSLVSPKSLREGMPVSETPGDLI